MKRFDCAGCSGHCYGGYHMKEHEDGDWVRYEDVEKFKALYNAMRAELSNQYGDTEMQMEVYERYPEWKS